MPSYIYLNIIGTFIIAYSFGSFIGMGYVILKNILINIFMPGSGILIYSLLVQLCEAAIIGLARNKKNISIKNIFIITFILSIFIRPLGYLFYTLFSDLSRVNGIIFIKEIISKSHITFVEYFKKYLISGFLSYLLIKTIKILIKKGEYRNETN